MKMFKNGYWQKMVIILSILVELGLVIAFVYLLTAGFLESSAGGWILLALWLVSIAVAIFAVNNDSGDEYKIVWLFMMAAFPVFGLIFYIMFAHKIRTKKESRFLARYYAALSHDPTTDETARKLEAECPAAADVSHYIEQASESGAYTNSKVEYFPLGDVAFPVMLRELSKAKHYIFIEYFIITPGLFWDSILSILKEKVKEGVDVRVVYDDVGNLGSTPVHYYKRLREYGIKAYSFAKIKPVLDVRMNNRDHRKIMVIDGHTCFTGGINLADEYINHVQKHGHWKDNSIMIKGKAVYGFTLLFLSNWVTSFEPKEKINYDHYRPETYIDEDGGFPVSDGFVQPYGAMPYSNEEVGEGVYLSIMGKATNYAYISTPYLILDEKLREAIRIAALQGTDVRILVPGVPDKKLVFQLTKSNYGPLLQAGVKIYEYTPGFVHQKMVIVDDTMATEGTINMDYRSLYLHLECGTFLAKNRAIGTMKQDFLDTIGVSHEVSFDEWKKWRKKRFVLWTLLRLVGPLL
ncbi:MAG: cardiolipin synthase [Bacilli bacterium]|jgi:cardiolipin synthase|nr:cardiolipin synthase [Bacilli bacterium]